TLPFPLDGAEQHRFGGDAPDTLAGGRLGDGLFGGAGADSLAGNEGDDALGGGAGDDTLSGGSGDDRLEGESGADLLEGGAGWDLLLGGEGADTYVFGSAHGNDIVLDADSGGDRVLIAGRDVATLDLRAVEPGANLYRDDAFPGIQAQRQVDGLLLTGAEGMVLLSGWRQNGDFGISLRDAGAREPGEAPGVTDGREIRGDLAVLDTDPASPGLQSGTDELGNLLTDPATPEFRDDQLFGSAGGDRLLGGGGADRLLARGGNDEVHGDAGSDQLLGEAGDDWLSGGEGTDVLAGGAGADRLFAATGNPSAGETSSSDRDWLAGGEGDDTLTGSAGSEGFSGGPGADLVFAGAGDDQVLSDADIVVMSFDWGWVDDTAEGTRRFTPAEGSIDPPGAGADTVHGGDGNDWLSLGRGADLGF
ncbi:MAG: calcium-binding protein, partial [Gammaproteobacteria bacterium]